MKNAISYLKQQSFSWYLGLSLLLFAGSLLVIPSWRLYIQEKLNFLMLSDAELSANSIIFDTKPGELLFEVEDMNGKRYNHDFFEGKKVFFNVWATWCAPCLSEMNGIEKLYKKSGSTSAFIIAAKDKPEKVRAYIKRKGYTMPVYILRGFHCKYFEINSFPTTFILNTKGQIIHFSKGAENWNTSSLVRYFR